MIMLEGPNSRFPKVIVQRFPVVAYVVLTYGISWTGALVVAAPYLLRHASIPKMTGIIMFPVMLLGPSLACIVLTWIGDGRNGLKDLFSRMRRARIPGVWYATLLIPPSLILIVLLGLKSFVSPIYAPNSFLIGSLFGLAAGWVTRSQNSAPDIVHFRRVSFSASYGESGTCPLSTTWAPRRHTAPFGSRTSLHSVPQ
jgi:hypothetical protein